MEDKNMSERIVVPFTPEMETTPERAFWDRFIRALEGLASTSEEIDMTEELSLFEDETEEDAITLIYDYYLQITTPPDESDELVNVEEFLRHGGILE
jgi:hypothetical protein